MASVNMSTAVNKGAPQSQQQVPSTPSESQQPCPATMKVISPHKSKARRNSDVWVHCNWDDARVFTQFLEKFYDATVLLSGSSYCTSPLFFTEVNLLLLLAVVLDPRCKIRYLRFGYSEIHEAAKREGKTARLPPPLYLHFTTSHQHHFTATTGAADDDVNDVLDSSFPDLRSPLISVVVLAAVSLSPAIGVALTTPLHRRRLLFNNVAVAPPPPPLPVLLCHRLWPKPWSNTQPRRRRSRSRYSRGSLCAISWCSETRQPHVDCAELRTAAAPCFLKTIIILLPRNTKAAGGL
ncbi:hypothetical protein RHGRI_017121 [Rhododendron griersonianum]|uniref:Uncharacterized protein n=1 Tax=Rhododendron griersonianum TaxID=479676 RepID=A0AAV6JWL6_9ERIC|nr:hypothetical protein RHGRI_017121 [Rhododendron griersonianum]